MSNGKPFFERRSPELLSATHRALRPLIGLLLSRGITLPAFVEMLKSAFVKAARDEFPLEGKKDTDSRLSLLTGIHRRDIKRIREQGEQPKDPSSTKVDGDETANVANASLSARVIALWMGLPEYRDEVGNPKPLARFARHGGEQSFESLVRQVNRDVRPRALLDEWLRRGAVSLDETERVCLNLNAFMQHRLDGEKLHYLALNIHDHLAAITHNLAAPDSPHLERCVYYGELTPESVAELETLAREEGMRALQLVNARALQLKQRDEGNAQANRRMNFGIYFYKAEKPQTDQEAAIPSRDTDHE